MKILAFNGSPRGEKSNSKVILDWIIEGTGQQLDQHVLRTVNKHQEYIETMKASDLIIIVFPLYVDAMPGIVMKFFEEMGKAKTSIMGKKILYVVHSGFPEGKQSYPVRRFLENFSEKLGLIHLDVVIMGGSEGTRLMPPKMLTKKHDSFVAISSAVANEQTIDESAVNKLLKPIELSIWGKIGIRVFSALGLANMYWNGQLKENGVFEQRFAQPYLDEVDGL